MRIAIIGSRTLLVESLEAFVPPEVTEIVSGGARGVDQCARQFAELHSYKYIEFLPDYGKYGKRAPLVRNDEIVEYSDLVLAFWDGKSTGTKYVIDKCKERGVPVKIFLYNKHPNEKNSLLFGSRRVMNTLPKHKEGIQWTRT